MTLACVRGCVRLRLHLAGCDDPDDCRGCLPRHAEHGDLCWPCHRRLQMMLHDAPTIDRWLTANLPVGEGAAKIRQDWERSAATGGSPAPLSVAIFDVRQQLGDQLAAWVDELTDEQHLAGPDRHTPTADAAYLTTWLDRVETAPWVADLWDELAQTTSEAHALAPWRPELRRCHGIACPSCGEMKLVIFGGEADVTCLQCREIIGPERYGIWVRILLEEQRGHAAS